ncbi:ChaN family lipoprotein [Pedobacter cryophilus]|uniref:Iron-regulated protein n=1 Tax=Pedobacter cryophilus TaxID=2571271 RepID=A0A4U1C050_9SPHI|nr:ChaN family lipoprotein [Pedobacter cryophilus]TKB98928.1 iron-regulated protein [Pedobacter cryophilus]
MKKIFFLLFLNIIMVSAFSQEKPAYQIYNAQGEKVSYGKMLKALTDKEVILFGELHNNAISHWLQYEVTSALSAQKKLILGAEMFEADNQNQLNDYLKGTIDAKALKSTARLWPNYATDYAPLVDLAKEKQLSFVATNIPRKYANLVYKNGFGVLDSLPEQEKVWIAPLPITFDAELPTYKNILKMMGEHGSDLLVKAQAVKDATMAHFILKNYQKDHVFIHYNGAYHSDRYEGILWYLKRENSKLKYGTISTVSQENINQLSKENLNLADFIICVDSNMTNTY